MEAFTLIVTNSSQIRRKRIQMRGRRKASYDSIHKFIHWFFIMYWFMLLCQNKQILVFQSKSRQIEITLYQEEWAS